MPAKVTPQLIGRSEVLGEINHLLQAPLASNVAMILLSGEEGVGKSFLLRTVVENARSHGLLALSGRSQESEIPQPFQLLQSIMSSLKRQREEEGSTAPDSSQVSGGVGLIGTFSRDRKSSLPMMLLPLNLAVESPEEREERLLATLSGRETDVEEEQMVLFDRLADHMEDAAEGRRIILAVDDLQHADHASMEFIEYFTRRAKGHNVRILATVRTGFELPEWMNGSINSLKREGLIHGINLRSFTEAESSEFLKTQPRGRELPEETLKEWYSVSKGNPLALEQLLTLGIGGPHPSETRGENLGSSLLATLDPEEHRIISHAAVLGKRFRFPTLHNALGGDEEKLTETMDSFLRRGLFKDMGEETYEFSGDDLWAEAFNSMTERHRRILHGKVAASIEVMETQNPLATFELADHFHIARNSEKSLLYNGRAAEISKRSQDHESEAHFLEQALQTIRKIPSRDRKREEALLVDLAIALDTIGEVDKAIKTIQEVTTTGLPTLHLARIMTHAGRWKEAEDTVMKTLSMVEASGDSVMVGMAHRMLGGMASYSGRFEEAAAHYRKAVEHLNRAGMKAEAASARLMLLEKNRLLSTISDAEVEEGYKTTIAELRELKNGPLLTAALMNFGLWYTEKGRTNESVRYLEEALKVARSSKDARSTGWTLFNLADIVFMNGEVDRAMTLNEEASGKLERIGDKLGLIQVHLVKGRIFSHKGMFPEAEIEFLDAFRLAEDVGFEPDQLEVIFRQAEFYLLKGDKPTALKMVEELDLHGFGKIRPDLKRDMDRFKEALAK